jgi:ketosteroid isomerase-like protein
MSANNIEVVKEYFKKFLSGKKEEAFKLLDDKIIWTVKGSANVPTVGLRNGKKEVENFFEKFQDTFEPKEFNINHYFMDDNLVFAIGNFTHYIKENQRLVSSDWLIEFEVIDKKITSYKILEDSYALFLAFKK